NATTATESLLRIERDHRMAAFPDAIAPGIPSESDSVTEVPNPDQFFELTAGGRDACRQRISIVQRDNRRLHTLGFQCRRQLLYDTESLELPEVRRLLDDSPTHNSGEAGADGNHRCSFSQAADHIGNDGDKLIGGNGFQIQILLAGLRILA